MSWPFVVARSWEVVRKSCVLSGEVGAVSVGGLELWGSAGDRAPLGLGYLSSYCKELLKVDTKIKELIRSFKWLFFPWIEAFVIVSSVRFSFRHLNENIKI